MDSLNVESLDEDVSDSTEAPPKGRCGGHFRLIGAVVVAFASFASGAMFAGLPAVSKGICAEAPADAEVEAFALNFGSPSTPAFADDDS